MPWPAAVTKAVLPGESVAHAMRSCADLRETRFTTPASASADQLAVKRSCELARWCDHRLARGLRRARGDGVDDGAVLGDGRGPGAGGLEVAAELLEQRVVALVVELGDDAQQHRVVRRLGDAHVEQPVAPGRGLPAGGFVFHHRDGFAQAGDLRFLHRACGMRGELAFDQRRARMVSSGASAMIRRANCRARPAARRCPSPCAPRPGLDLQRDQRLAHRRPRHAELHREVALRRQPAAHREFAALDQRAQLVGDLPVQAARRDGLQGHWAVKWSDQFGTIGPRRTRVKPRSKRCCVIDAGASSRRRLEQRNSHPARRCIR